MMTENLRQRRGHLAPTQNGDTKHVSEKNTDHDPEFAPREAPLTVLLESSKHMRVTYNIFVSILVLLFFDSLIYDLVENGRVNIAQTPVIEGFGDVRRGAKLWLFEFTVAVAFYPALRLYAVVAKLFTKTPGLRRIWPTIGVAGVIAIITTIIGVPAWDLSQEYLSAGSSAFVSCEMFRLSMKVWAVAAACAPRCHSGSTPLPSIKHYLYFLFAPTLLYRDHYPRTKKIRWGKVFLNFLEVVLAIYLHAFLWQRFVVPVWSDYGKQPTVTLGRVFRNYFISTIPGTISFITGFYFILHAWQNAWAEMLTFADRLCYEEWWTASHYSAFYRTWNRVVSTWLRDHIYWPLEPHTGRFMASFGVFAVSAIAHEVILVLSFGFFNPVMLVQFGMLGFILIPLTNSIGKKYPKAFNLVMWPLYFIGNGILWSLYPMEYFARKNCPVSPNESYFIPKSWSCPEIVLNSNWTFQSPF